MTAGQLECWKCGQPLLDMPLPPGRADVCPGCNADLHVCRLCTFYDTTVANACREPIAEHVGNKERANFCGYFTPRPDAHAGSVRDGPARAALDELFGLGDKPGDDTDGTATDPARQELDQLFGLNKKTED
jgi:hypothetical protein